jgi:hypothetical protein
LQITQTAVYVLHDGRRGARVLEQIVITNGNGKASHVTPVLIGELAAQFPSVYITAMDLRAEADVAVRASDWRRREFDVYRFDYDVDCAVEVDDFILQVIDDDAPRSAALEILNRCQRAIRRRNRHSQGKRFESVLSAHRALHDLDKPLVRADYNHALDTWQWLLRLAPDASPALQLAALFHDVERLRSEADARVEHRADDYVAFKQRHAAAGAEIASETLARCGIDTATRDRVAQLIAGHEQRSSDDAEVSLLNDADALSFFSLNSTGFADYFGPEHTRRKLDYTLARLGDTARAHLASIHLRSDVRELLASCAG